MYERCAECGKPTKVPIDYVDVDIGLGIRIPKTVFCSEECEQVFFEREENADVFEDEEEDVNSMKKGLYMEFSGEIISRLDS